MIPRSGILHHGIQLLASLILAQHMDSIKNALPLAFTYSSDLTSPRLIRPNLSQHNVSPQGGDTSVRDGLF